VGGFAGDLGLGAVVGGLGGRLVVVGVTLFRYGILSGVGVFGWAWAGVLCMFWLWGGVGCVRGFDLIFFLGFMGLHLGDWGCWFLCLAGPLSLVSWGSYCWFMFSMSGGWMVGE